MGLRSLSKKYGYQQEVLARLFKGIDKHTGHVKACLLSDFLKARRASHVDFS
jgi:hypothetical protein